MSKREEPRRRDVESRVRERDENIRRLYALERIATASLDVATTGEICNLGAFFGKLLDMFLDVADNADSAAILLRERDRLLVRATAGRHAPLFASEVVVGEGFAGTIAATGQPLFVGLGSPCTLAAATLAPGGLGTRRDGVRCLYGVPLMSPGEVIGVVQIGSATHDDLSEVERRLLLPTAERAAWAVAQRDLARSRSERAELLERERASRAEAEIANRAKNDFLATVSHELRTPLNAMLGWTAIARRQAPPQMLRAITLIERNARAQTRIIEDVLSFSHILSGKLRLEIAPTDIGAAIDDALAAARPVADAKGIRLSVSTVHVGSVAADAERIRQVVWNVLSNAIKFTPRGGGVELSTASRGPNIVIRVADTGEGIDPSFLPHIFDAFRQADGSSTRRHGGLGLGLAIVKQLVRAHGGFVAAASPGVNQGSTFTIELPVRPAPATRTEPALSRAEPLADVNLDRLTLLLVVDDDDSRVLLEESLTARGALVACASSARDALEQVPVLRPTVLVSDVGRADLNALAFIQDVRRLPPERGGLTPAIALTAYTRTSDLQRARAAGFQMHVAKPVDLEFLASAIANLAGFPPRS